MTVATRVELPDKLYFKIGEVKDIVGVKQHVLRYWESEFSSIRPQKSKTNQRLYRRKDVEAILAIKHLLYERKFTIEGAKLFLKEQGVQSALPAPDPDATAARVRDELEAKMLGEVAKERKAVVDHYEKHLVELHKDVQEFIARIKGDAPS